MKAIPNRRVLVALVAIVLHASLSAGQARAAGYGAFFEYGWDTVTTGGDLEVLPSLTGIPLSVFDRNSFGVGFSFDSNLARDRVFNNRLDVGFHITDFANVDAPGGKGLVVNNAFGFGLYRGEKSRLWIGPAVRVDADWYDIDDVVDVQVGWGPQIGFNRHLGRNLTATLSFAYNFKWGWFLLPNGSSVSYNDNFLAGSLAFYFRTSDDQYRSRP